MESKLKANMRNFFSNRNGIDELTLLTFTISMILGLFSMIFPHVFILYILNLIFLIYSIFRILSKNTFKRESENQWFMNLFKRKNKVKVKKVIKAKTKKEPKVKKEKVKKEKVKKEKIKKEKGYVYLNCPNCNNLIKVNKKIKGERLIMCGKCYTEFKAKIK